MEFDSNTKSRKKSRIFETFIRAPAQRLSHSHHTLKRWRLTENEPHDFVPLHSQNYPHNIAIIWTHTFNSMDSNQTHLKWHIDKSIRISSLHLARSICTDVWMCLIRIHRVERVRSNNGNVMRLVLTFCMEFFRMPWNWYAGPQCVQTLKSLHNAFQKPYLANRVWRHYA